jgi:hypothetical protein
MFKKTHGATSGNKWTRTYSAWKNMKSRCSCKSRPDFKFYGGRGISFVKKWRKFENFIEDMGDCPKGLTLDRINTNGNYSKKNCRWIPQEEQKANMRSNVFLSFRGKRLHLSAWAREIGIPEDAVWYRHSQGWPVKKILTKPLGRWA